MSNRECRQMAFLNPDQTDPWDLSLLTRWRLYKRWVQQWQPNGQRKHTKLIRDYCAKRAELDELRLVADIEVMRKAKVGDNLKYIYLFVLVLYLKIYMGGLKNYNINKRLCAKRHPQAKLRTEK
jgi:hypothetical protein